MASHNDFGKEAEEKAVAFLEKKGYQILAQNYRFQKAEIDIIAEFKNQFIIIEVKARADNHFMEPFEAVNKRKMRLILSATQHFLEDKNEDKEVRFDIISILKKGDNLEINHLENAFEAFDAN